MKILKIDQLLEYTKDRFARFKDNRGKNKQYGIGDSLQSGLAIFSLKDSSLLEFNKRLTKRKDNLKRVFKIDRVPPDETMREIIDEINPLQIEKVKKGVLQQVKEQGLFKEFEYFGEHKLLLIDGVHHHN